MEFKISQKPPVNHRLYIINDVDKLNTVPVISPEEMEYAGAVMRNDQNLVTINRLSYFIFIYLQKPKLTDYQTDEGLRKGGSDLQALCSRHKIAEITLVNISGKSKAAFLMAEGMALANYQFLKYKSDANKQLSLLKKISFTKESATVKETEMLEVYTEAIYKVRDMVNEPLNFMTATQLSEEFEAMGKEAGFKVTVLHKEKIEKEGMGGLLAVNKGSIDPPTFSVM